MISFDLHTHTTYSHGKGSILDNVKAAAASGLEEIGIADHGPGHIGYGINMNQLLTMKQDIEEAKKAFPNIKIYLGLEANIINPSGNLDISKEDQKNFDYILAGYHYGVIGEAPFRAIKTHIDSYYFAKTGKAKESRVIFNTDLVVKALENNNIKILTHPGDKGPFDIDEIAKTCERTGTWMEINSHHNGLDLEGIKTAMKYDVTFVFSSDAHRPVNVANVYDALTRAKFAGLDLSRVINYRG